MTTLELPVPAPRAAPPVRRDRGQPRPRGGPAPLRLPLPGRVLLLVAGMPGAGKSTLLARLPRRPGLALLDSDVQRAALARRLPGLPYCRYRPLVHLLHRLALVRAAFSTTPTLVVHLPATGLPTRAAVALLARLTGRTAHLLWLHVDPAEALRGQRDRGRLVPGSSFAAHAARAVATTAALRTGPDEVGWASVTVVDRAAVRAGLALQ